MRLMTKELEKRFAQIGSQENVKDPVIVAKYFDPLSEGGDNTLYATEYDPKTKTFFGYVILFGGWINRWEHFSLEELRAEKAKRDPNFREQRISSVIR